MSAIPQTLHLLCIGDTAPPATLAGWAQRHPGWQVRTWTDDDLDTVAWRLRERMAGLIEAQGAGARDEVATLMRWEILAELGGVAVLPGRALPEGLAERLAAGGHWAEDAAAGWIACTPGHPTARAAADAALSARAGGRGQLNIVMMTIRTSPLMRRITEVLAADCRRHPGVRLTVADGAEDAEKSRWLAELAAQGGDLRVISQRDPTPRFAAALTDDHDWTLLVADDDPFSLDYVDVYLDHLAQASPGVAVVPPSAYVRRVGSKVVCNTITPVGAADPATRLAGWMGQRDVHGLAYYAAVRTPVFLEWHRYLHTRPYSPTHGDQLLTALAALRGGIEPVRGCNALTRDDANWATDESWHQSDMRCYPHPDMVLLHELWWVADYVRLLGLAGRPALAAAVKPRVVELLTTGLNQWALREHLARPRPGIDWPGLRQTLLQSLQALLQADEPADIDRLFQRIEAFARATESFLLAD